MGFFRRFAEGLGHSTPVAGIAEAAASWGWEAVDDPFHGGTTDLIKGAVRTLHGAFRTMRPTDDHAPRMLCHDAYRGTRDGRTVTVAERVASRSRRWSPAANTSRAPPSPRLELSTVLMIAGIEPRLRHQGIPGPEVPTGTRPSIPHTASSGWLASPRAS